MKRTSALLINEPPLQVLPSLAVQVGLPEAMLLQQLHYWLGRATIHDDDGRDWVYKTIAGWRSEFPFWSEPTIKRAFSHLVDLRILRRERKADNARDRTGYYSIDYDQLDSLMGSERSVAAGKNDPLQGINLIPSSIRQRLPTETTNRDTPLGRASARPTGKGVSLGPLADAFRTRGLDLDVHQAREAHAASDMLKRGIAPEKIAAFWDDVRAERWGDQFARENLSMAYLNSNRR